MLDHLWSDLEGLLQTYGLWAVTGSVFVESFGAPLPAESLLIAAGFLATQGKMSILNLLALSWAASVLGDNVGYCIGRFAGRRLILRYGRYVFVTHERLNLAEAFFLRYGGVVVLVARFVLVLRQLNGIVAGTSRMPWRRFMLYNASGALIWVGVWGGGSYLFGQEIENLLDRHKNAEPYLIAGILVVIAIGVAVTRRWLRKHRAGLSSHTSVSHPSGD